MVLDGPVSATVKLSSLKPTVNISLFLWLWAEAIGSKLGNRKENRCWAWKEPREDQRPRGKRKIAKLAVAGYRRQGNLPSH